MSTADGSEPHAGYAYSKKDTVCRIHETATAGMRGVFASIATRVENARAAATQRQYRASRRRRQRSSPHPSHEARLLEQLRAAHPDRIITWSVPTPGHRGGWLALSFALTDPGYREVGLSHSAWAPTAAQLADRIAAQDALAAGVATAMNLYPPADHGADPLADVRAELAPLARDVAVRVLCQRSGIHTA